MVTGVVGALLLLLVTAWAEPAQAVPMCAAGQGCVVVQVMGGPDNTTVQSQMVIPPSEIDADFDVTEGDYQTLYASGRRLLTSFNAATTVPKLLSMLLMDRYASVDHVVVNRPLGAPGTGSVSNTLSAQDLNLDNAGGTWLTSGEAPLFFTQGGQSITYLRPQHTEVDVNGSDEYFSEITGAPIILQVFLVPGPVLRPVISPLASKIKPGGTVKFSVSYADQNRPVAPVRYLWSFENDQPLNCSDTNTADDLGPNPEPHTYPRGSFRTYVTVCGQNSEATSGFATIDAEPSVSPVKGPKPGGAGSTNSPVQGLDTGPDAGKGKRAGDSGSLDGLGGSGTSVLRGSGGARPKQQQASAGKKNLEIPAVGETVSGVLLDPGAARSLTIRAPVTAPVSAAALRRATSIPRDWRWLLALLPVALLLGGVARQTPWLARRLPRIPWRDV